MFNKLINKFFLFVFVLLSINIYAQVNLDSLWSIWKNESQEDTIRLKALDDFILHGYIVTSNDSAFHYAQIQFEFANEKGLKENSAFALDKLGSACKNKGEFSEAIKYFQHSLELFKEVGNRKKTAHTLYWIGKVHWTVGDYEIAKEYYRSSLTIAKEIEDEKWEYQCLSGIAYSFYQQGQFTQAIIFIQKCLKLSEKIKYDHGIAWSLNAISAIYENQGNKEKGLEYSLRSLEISEKIGDESLASYTMHRIGDIYFDLGDKLKAKDFYERGLAVAEELNNKRSISFALQGLGRIHEYDGEIEKALENFKRSLSLVKEIGDIDTECEILKRIGQAQIVQGNYILGIEECQKSYEIAIKIGSFDDQMDACKWLYKGNKALGKYAKALEFHEKILMLEDSINYEALAKNLQQMEFTRQMFADSLKQEEEKLKIEMNHRAELGEKDMTRNIFIVSGLIIMLIAGGLWNRMRFTRKANARLKKEKDRAESSEQFKHQFLANMSHEIRTPMNAIKGMSDILIRRKPKADQIKYLNAIKESSDSLLVIINDILDLSKIEIGKVDIEHIPFSISEMIKNVHTIMQFKAEEKGLELKTDIPANIPHIIGDPTRLRQVIINLVGNAIKFTEKGIVTTSLKIETQQDGTNISAHFTISDTGIGIEKDKLEQVFNSFEQAYSDTSRKFGGTGLGLSISKKLIELQNGKIWVDSKKGVGSQFHFTLPYTICKEKENIKVGSTTSNIQNISEQLKGIRILLAEDNAFNAVVAQEELEDAIEEAVVVVAENGAIAVEQISHNDFDVVLMDVQMPVMNGYEATKAIRDLSDEKSKIPIIAMTANVLKEEVELCYKVGMNGFIGKPFDTEELIQKIYKLTHQQT
ncbi:MAG: tetratricopeptide repeat protein [Bacteroidota bacterium]